MTRLGFVFPGQGAQYPGMGKELAQNYTEAALVFEQADDILGYSLSKLCFEGPADKLNQTEYAQPALLTTSTAILKVVEKQGWQASMMAGLSLGEYSALVAAQSITLEEALPLVQARAHLMQEAVPAGQGSMAAVLGLDHNMVENACRNAAGLIDVANYNCPGQVVISGEAQVVAEVGSELKKAGGRVIPLKVSVPSHSRLMSPAAEGLKPLLDKIPWKEPGVPVLSNVNAASNTAAQLPDILAAQLISSVRWEQSMIHMLEQVDNIIEIGPGSTLSGLIKKINKERLLGHIEDLDSLNNIEKKDESNMEQVAIVTGSSRGIGKAIALQLARDGFKVVINYNHNEELAAEVLKTIEAEGGAGLLVKADVSDPAQANALIETTVAEFGQVDILVNNAGINKDGLVLRMSDEDWNRVISTNLNSVFYCTRAVLKHMTRKRYGRIINISSVVGLHGNAGQAHYAAAKAGILGFTFSIAQEYGVRGITANIVAPGFIRTDLTDVLSEEQKAKIMARVPVSRLGNPEDVAFAVSTLASPRAGYISAQVLRVDGGLTGI